MSFNTADPESVVHAPYTPDEPIYYDIERISAVLGEDLTQGTGRVIFSLQSVHD